ncbi:pathogen-associated molecular patterns-induced protein A70-like [Pistacia vera]|uniref:pathogen-associated molecular patterns-induced protein A70-like n=1 Tax=Pistacia vera TaxID=55513 RepID=UPI001262FA2B|nr:pathogen-associated molecular patterns-induced protein A70-like [Pistacia vera]
MTDPSLLTSITSWFTPPTLFLFVNLVIGTIAVISRFNSFRKPQSNQQHQLGPYDSPPLARAPSLIERVKSINFSLYKFPNPEEEQPSFVQPTSEHLYNSYPVDPNPPQLARAPSLLERVKSNLFSYKLPNPEEEQPPFVQPTEPLNDTYLVDPNPPGITRAPSLLERVKSIKFPSVYGSQQSYPETETKVIHNSETEVPSDPDYKPKRSKSETKKSKQRSVQEKNLKKSVSEKLMKVETENDETETLEQRRPQTARLDRTETIGDDDQGVDAKADDFINNFRRQLKLQRLDSLLRYKEMLKGN